MKSKSTEENLLTIDELNQDDSLKQFSMLLDHCFQVPQGQRFLDDFPIWDISFQVPNILRIGAFQESSLRACAAVRTANLMAVGGNTVKVAIIGAVASHPELRGKGVASQLVSVACQWAKGQGAALVALWGSEHELYRRIGFELVGSQLRVPLRDLVEGDVASYSTAHAGEIHSGWAPGIFNLAQKRTRGLRLEDSDRQWWEGHRHTEWYYYGDPKAPRAYLGMGRGIDLANIIHEWGGDPTALKALFADLVQKRPEASLLGYPKEIHSLGVSLTTPYPSEFLCLAKVLDPLLLCRAFTPHLSVAATQQDQKTWDFSLGGYHWNGISEGLLARTLFGPNDSDWNPLPLWFWGLDAG